MTPSEESQLQATGTGRRQILEAQMAHLQRLSHHYAKPGRVCEPGDLLSVGYLAMEKAIQSWEPRPAVPFWAYARSFVRAAMSKTVRQAVTPSDIDPNHLTDIAVDDNSREGSIIQTRLNQLPERQRRVLELRLLQTPRATEEEAAAELGIEAEDVRSALWSAITELKTQS